MSAAWFFDSINGHPLPVLIVRGWCTDRANVDIKLECSDGTTRGPDLLCREPRHDVVAVHMLDFFWPGFIAEFHLKALPAAILMFGTRVPVYNPGQYCVTVPHYYHLYETDQVLHRDDIYRSGPPTSAHPAVVELASSLLGSRILDFGCGNGDLVSRLRERGREAVGVEIDRPEIREHLCPDAAPHVTLYDGSLPLPYADKSFDSVVATEVIEHVHDPHAVAQELIRVAQGLHLRHGSGHVLHSFLVADQYGSLAPSRRYARQLLQCPQPGIVVWAPLCSGEPVQAVQLRDRPQVHSRIDRDPVRPGTACLRRGRSTAKDLLHATGRDSFRE